MTKSATPSATKERTLRNFLDNSIAEHKSKPPLRWIANWAGNIACRGIGKVAYMEDNAYEGWRYKVNLFLWKAFWPIYRKYGTFYTLDMDLSGEAWDDYDKDGVPYWEKTGTLDPDYDDDISACFPCCGPEEHCGGCIDCDNDFEDPETGDAFRIISRA